MRNSLHRVAFAVAVAGAMGFGGTQAFAAPAEAGSRQSCSPIQCRQSCRAVCGSTCTGYCDPVAGCYCEYI